MDNTLINQAIQSVLNSQMAFCKFLSANDTGLTGAHQVGILCSFLSIASSNWQLI